MNAGQRLVLMLLSLVGVVGILYADYRVFEDLLSSGGIGHVIAFALLFVILVVATIYIAIFGVMGMLVAIVGDN